MWLITLVLLAIAAYFIVRLLLTKNVQNDINSEAATGGASTAEAAETAAGGDATAAGVATAAGAATAAGVATAAAVAAASVTATDAVTGGAPAASAASPATTASAKESSVATQAVNSGNHILDIQDMLKILNLRDSDASRLAISREQYNSLKTGNAGDLNSEQVQGVVSRLQQMMD